MLNDFNNMTCDVCGKKYYGYEPAPDSALICRNCIKDFDNFPLIDENEEVPESVHEEFLNEGDDDE